MIASPTNRSARCISRLQALSTSFFSTGIPYLQYIVPAAKVASDPESCPSRQPGAHKAARKGFSVVEAYVGERYAHGARTWTQIGISRKSCDPT